MRSRNRLGWLAALCLFTTLGALPKSASAVPSLRFQTDLRGDMVLFGNTLGFDCRTGMPDPKVGTVNRGMCTTAFPMPAYVEDSSSDVFWRSEDNGQVSARSDISLSQARSAAILQLPPGATVAYARIYWSSTVFEDMTNVSSIVIDRPGGGAFTQTINAQPVDIQAADRSFQATADITELVQAHGAGIYRVAGSSGFPKSQMTDHYDDNNYAAWAVVVFYKRDTDPVRNLSVYDGLTFVSPTNNSGMTLRGFSVPAQNAGESKLAVVGYEGDPDQPGDSLILKGTIPLSDGQPGGSGNFFNSSRTNLGQNFSILGDLPEFTGEQGSMSGIDLDVIDLTPHLVAGDTQAQLDMITGTTIGSDLYFVGAIATSIASRKPVIESHLTVPGSYVPLPGDTVEYTLTIKNSGDDTATEVFAEQTLPPGLTFVPGSLTVVSGTTQSSKTDMIGDDEFDYDGGTRTLRIRLGTGANAVMGGQLTTGNTVLIVKYLLRVADEAFGNVATQVFLRATPLSNTAIGATIYPSGNGTLPNHPTVISVRECMNNYDCTVTAPVCDVRLMPHRCTASCANDADCLGAPGGQDICGAAMRCAQCAPGKLAACTPDGLGSACLATGACGCATDADCGGRKCDTATGSCPKPSADLNPVISSDSDAIDAAVPVVIGVSVNNKGPAVAPTGTQLLIQVPAGGSLQDVSATGGWRCTLESNAVRCTYLRPIPAGQSSPEVKLTIVLSTPAAPGEAASLTVTATSSSTTANDPNPGDNMTSRTLDVGRLRVAGGGFGCNFLPDGRVASLWSVAAVVLAALATRRRRWTNRANA